MSHLTKKLIACLLVVFLLATMLPAGILAVSAEENPNVVLAVDSVTENTAAQDEIVSVSEAVSAKDEISEEDTSVQIEDSEADGMFTASAEDAVTFLPAETEDEIMLLAGSASKLSTSVVSVNANGETLYYDTVEEAWADALATESAVTISMLVNITFNGTLEIPAGSNCDITIKQDGLTAKTLTSTGSEPVFVVNGGKLAISTGTYSCGNLVAVNGGDVTIGGIGIKNQPRISVFSGSLTVNNSAGEYGTVNVSGGDFTISNVKAISDLEVSGGTVEVVKGTINSASVSGDAALTVSDGTVNNVDVSGGTVAINSGTVSGMVVSGGTVEISGGTVNGVSVQGGTVSVNDGQINDLTKTGGMITVNGGVYTSADRDFLQKIGLSDAEQKSYYVVDNNGTYVFAKTIGQIIDALSLAGGDTLTLVQVPEDAGNITIDSSIVVENKTGDTITVNGTEIPNGHVVSDVQIEVDGKVYYSLQSALDAVSGGETVKLLTDVALGRAFTIGKSITLDLNGHTISGGSTADKKTLIVKGEDIVVRIDDTSASQNGSITSNIASCKVVSLEKGTLILEKGTIEGTGSSSYGVSYGAAKTTLEMNGGKISARSSAVYMNNFAGIFTMTGGTISGTYGVYVAGTLASAARISIQGGTVTGTTNAVYQTYGNVEIIGGTFNGSIKPKANGMVIKGGKFSDKITNTLENYLESGFVFSDLIDGYYEVVYDEGGCVAQIGDKKYATLQQAINAAQSGDTVELLRPVELTEKVTIKGRKDITLDLKDNNLTLSAAASAEEDVLTVYNGTNLTITGSGTIQTTTGGVAIRVAATDPRTTVTIDTDVTVKGQTGLLVQPLSYTSDSKTASAEVIVKGKLISEANNGSGLNIQGELKNGQAIISIADTAVISGSLGIYAAGNGDITIDGGTITGEATGIEIRAGKLTVNDGSTITAKSDFFSVNGNGSGSTTTGAGIAVSQHATKKPIEVIVNGGTVTGYVALNVADPQGNDDAKNIAIQVIDGDFIANGTGADSASVHVSDDYNVSGFVKGGNFSDSLMETGYLAPDLQAELNSTTKNADAPFSYYPTMTDALRDAEDGDTVTNVKSMEDENLPVPITFNAGYDQISIVVYVKSSDTYKLPGNEYFIHPDGLAFLGWKIGSEDDIMQSNETTDILKAGTEVDLTDTGLILIAQWGEPVDKIQLETTIDQAEKFREEDYTTESWKAMQDALTTAKTVLADENATQEEVDAATAALQKAIGGLVRKEADKTVDKTALQEAIIEAEGLDEADYTAESWKVMQDALTTAKTVLADENATQKEVDAITATLQEAIANLVEKDTDPNLPGQDKPQITDPPETPQGSAPQTGDESLPVVWLSLFILSLSGIACVVICKRRYNQ